jgi:hypothetical protein
MTEIWKEVTGFDGLYLVSNFGRVKSFRRGKEKILSQHTRNRYMSVGLYADGKMKRHYVHRLVGNAFISNPNNYPCINHKDQTTANNNINNLEWCTHSYNNTYGDARGKRLLNTDFTAREKSVAQIDKAGNFVRRWKSMSEAERMLNIPESNISNCCRGKVKTAGGFVWKFYKEVV